MALKTITVSKSGSSINVNPLKPTLKKSQNDRVKWKGSPPNLNFVICFPKITPFKHRHFDKVKSASGRIIFNPPETGKFFKYNVEVGDSVLDPGIIIER